MAKTGFRSSLVLRNRNFRVFMAGVVMMSLGAGAQTMAIGWEIYARTGEVMTLGITALLEAIPMLLLTLPAGYLADRFDRRRVAGVALAIAALNSLGLAYLSWTSGPIPWIYLLVGMDATALTLARPSRGALLPTLVPSKMLADAIMWRSSIMQLTGVVGPALGGLIISLWPTGAYLFCTCGFLIGITTMLALESKQTLMAKGVSPVKSVLEGIGFLLKTRVLFAACSLDLLAVLLGGATYLLPVFTRDVLHAEPWAYGVMRAAPALGASAMALWLANRAPMRHAGRAMLWSVAGFGVATIGFGLSRNVWLSAGFLFFTGLFDFVSVVVRSTLLQLLTPDEMRGRVTAANWIFVGSSNQLGGVESSTVAKFVGPVASVVIGGIGSIFVAGAAALAAPELRRVGSLRDPKSAAGK